MAVQRLVLPLLAAVALAGHAVGQPGGTFTLEIPQLKGGVERDTIEIAPGTCETTRAYVQNPGNTTVLVRVGVLQRADAPEAGAGPEFPSIMARVTPSAAELAPNQTQAFTVEACAFPTAEDDAASNLTLDVVMFPPGASAGQLTLRAVVAPPPSDASLPAGAWAALAAAVGLGAAWAFARRVEWLRYAWLAAVAPLYTRLAPSRLLEQEKREAIFRLVEQEPGIHFSALMERTKLPNGVLVHHLRQLERHKLVASRREGPLRRFVATPAPFPPPAPKPLTPMQARVMDLLATTPRTQREIAESLGLTQQGANRHVKALERRGLLAIRYHEGQWRCHALDRATTPALQSPDESASAHVAR